MLKYYIGDELNMNEREKHITEVMSNVSQRMQGVSTPQLIGQIAKNSASLKEISLEDQFLLAGILGSKLHQAYCDGRKLDQPLENGLQNNPRIKQLDQPLDRDFALAVLEGRIPTSDTLYVENGKVFMDIANTNFTQLSPYWQHDNFMAGACAARSIITNWDGLTHDNSAVRDYTVVAVANGIHEAWIARGNVQDWNSDLETAYINLPADEQDKDLVHYQMATDLIKNLQQEMENVQGNEQGGD